MARYIRIFASLDGASTQYAVARRALSIAHDNNAEVLFGHVIDSVPYEANGIDFAALIPAIREKPCADQTLGTSKSLFPS